MNTKNITMRLLTACTLLAATHCMIDAHTATTAMSINSYPDSLCNIVGLLVEEHDADWYRRQYEGWMAQVKQNPKDETAWLNCYRAKKYEITFDENLENSDSVQLHLIKQMQHHIPDTYTYFTCAYLGPLQGQHDVYEYGKKAYYMMPEKRTFFDYDTWLCYHKLYGEMDDYKQFAREYYKSGVYSNELIQLNRNELECMDKGAIFLGYGDATVIPKWLIQDGMGKHSDKLVLCYSFFYNPDYCKRLYNKLGIGEVPELTEIQSFNDYEDYVQLVINQVAVRTGRKMYMSKYNYANCYTLWAKNGSLYDVGLIYAVSPDKELDLVKEQKRSWKKCNMKYLDKRIKNDEWITVSRLSCAMTRNFTQLMKYYKDNGDKKNFKRIHSTLEKAVNRISNPIWYDAAFHELESIDDELEEDDITIDEDSLMEYDEENDQ